jgi:hypothetical protein
MVAIFPIALAIVFCYLAKILRDTIRLRRNLEVNGTKNVKQYLSNYPLWIDPGQVSGNVSLTKIRSKKLHPIMAWTVVAIVFLRGRILS